jgi:hypothetical protein
MWEGAGQLNKVRCDGTKGCISLGTWAASISALGASRKLRIDVCHRTSSDMENRVVYSCHLSDIIM